MKFQKQKDGFLGYDANTKIKSKVVVVPFGLEKTVSYGGGTKNAPKEMKKAVEKVKKYQQKFDDFKKQRKQWNSSIPENMTVRQVISKCDKLRNRKWRMQRTLNNKKRVVGYLYGDCVTKIIIPQKMSV